MYRIDYEVGCKKVRNLKPHDMGLALASFHGRYHVITDARPYKNTRRRWRVTISPKGNDIILGLAPSRLVPVFRNEEQLEQYADEIYGLQQAQPVH